MSYREFDLYVDRKHLATKAYGDSGNLQARSDIYMYQQPKVNLPDWVLGQVSWRGDERVVDVGCGPGTYLKRLATQPGLRLTALDISHGMLRDLEAGWIPGFALPVRAVADVQSIPLADASQDVVLSTHMLYHVPDIARAARDLRRVLRPGGTLLAVTNSDEHTAELFELFETALCNVSGNAVEQESLSLRFSRENGAELLGVAFDDVERRDKDSHLVIPSAEPVIRYLNSTRQSREPSLPDGITWDMVVAEAERMVEATIAEHGAFSVRTAVSLFICS